MNVAIASNLETLVHCPPRQWVKTNSSITAPTPLSRIAVTSITHDGSRALVTTTATNYLATGDRVTISGCNETHFNGTYEITRVSATTFTYVGAFKDAAATATGTILMDALIFFRRAVLYGFKAVRTANVGDVYIGPTSTNDDQPILIATVGENNLEAPVGGKFALRDWYLDAVTADDGLVMILS